MYRYLDAALIRAAAHPHDWRPPPPPAPSGDATADADRWRRWITDASKDPYVRAAVDLASPSLSQAVRDVCIGRLTAPKRVRRAGFALLRYIRRLQHRATPFGLFAGVAPAHIGGAAATTWYADHRLALRADAAWLAAVIDDLETCPELLRRLAVVADETAMVRGDRLVVPCRRPTRRTSHTPGELSVRHTPLVRAILAHTAAPVSVTELVERVAVALGAPVARLERLVAQLVTHGILLTGLRPPMTASNALGHVIDKLDAAHAHEIPVVAPTVRALHKVHVALGPPVPIPARPTSAEAPLVHGGVVTAMTEISAAEQPLAADLRLGGTVTLPAAVGREAASAANALARLTRRPSGSRSWREYHARFLDRYGTDVLVPVAQLTDPELGLGYPAGYRSSPCPQPEPRLTDRDERFLALAQQAACEGARELVLNDALIAELAGGEPAVEIPHADLCFRLEAPSKQALNRGDFTLRFSGLTPAAGALAGRFLHLLDAGDRDRMMAAYAGLPTVSARARTAQVSSPPLRVRTENVARVPAIFPDVISIAEHRPGSVPLSGLAVAADAERMYLISRDTGEPIEPAVLTAVDLPYFSHPLARFLHELPRAHAAVLRPFDWGAAANLPFLPRIRYRRTVLAPATWRLRAAELPNPAAPPAVWAEALHAWRHRFSVPDVIEAGGDDRRLHLDLQNGADLALLRDELNRCERIVVQEASEEQTAYGWLDGRPHEITLAVVSGQAPRPAPRLRAANVMDCRHHGRLPGTSELAQARLSSYHIPEVLRRLSTLLDDWHDEPPLWWFTHDHDDLWLTFRLSQADGYGRLTVSVGTWAEELRRSGLLHHLSWEAPRPDAARHGDAATAAALERVFAADTDAVLAQLALTGDGTPHTLAVATAGLVDLVTSFLGDTRAGMYWLIDNAAPSPARTLSRTITSDAIRLVRHPRSPQDLGRLPGGERIVTAWTTRRDALSTYRSRLAAEGRQPEVGLPILIQQHQMRAFGADNAGKRACHRLARAAALSWQATADRSPV